MTQIDSLRVLVHAACEALCGVFQVYKGLRRGVHEVAIKQLGNLSDPQLIRQFRKEIAILGRVSFQPNIVNFYGACLRDPENIMLVMENMAGASRCSSLWFPHRSLSWICLRLFVGFAFRTAMLTPSTESLQPDRVWPFIYQHSDFGDEQRTRNSLLLSLAQVRL